ncbi:MAG: citrate synthase [Oscillospiraceae bacterium]|nr:citrate synthase [Oscillospiraceae bacterium]
MNQQIESYLRLNQEEHNLDISSLCGRLAEYSQIDASLYDKYHVRRGLRYGDGSGVAAGITRICSVHGYIIDEGIRTPIPGELIYRGYDINDLVENAEKEDRFVFEEVVHLLLFGQLPTKKELFECEQALSLRRELPPGFLVDSIMQSPSKNIMNKLARSILSLYSYDENPDRTTLEDEMRIALNLIAKMPNLMNGAYQTKRHKFDNASMVMHQLRPEEKTAESILSLLRNDRSYTKKEAQLLDVMLALHAEHGGGNNSTFACRVATSSGTDPYAAYASAINSLKGPRHGGANIKVMEMLDDIKEHVKNWEDEGEVADYLTKHLKREAGDRSGLIYGMGHAVYTLSDPRAVILKRKAFELAAGREIEAEFRLLDLIEKLTPELMVKVRGIDKTVCANVDMYSGLVYRMLGIPDDLFTPLFASARMVGWSAHRMEEILTGKRIIRPAYRTIAKGKKYIPLEDRTED